MFAPGWALELADGRLLDEGRKSMITAISCKATIDGADELVIEAAGFDSGSQTYRILGERILAPGNLVVLRAGYLDEGDELVALQRFRLVREEARYTEGAVPSVTIRGYSAEATLVEYTLARSWEGPIRDSDIVAEIADFHGLLTDSTTIASTIKRTGGRVKAEGTHDLAFLQELAVANGYGPPLIRYDARRKLDVLYFRPTRLSDQDVLATFRHLPGGAAEGGTLLSFSPELSLGQVPTAIEVLGWDEAAQEPIRVVLQITAAGQETTIQTGNEVGPIPSVIRSGSQLQVRVLGDTVKPPPAPATTRRSSSAKPRRASATSTGERREVVSTSTVLTTEDARAWALRWYETRQKAFMVGRANVVGWPHLWPGQIHRFVGLAPHHEGLWEWTTVEHRFTASGYTCEGEVSRVLEDAATPDELGA